ncbi:1-deoxy-D-xylulose-5-phosphate synthase N-terminal domain-containing protein [Zymomonas mobilis]|uniref:1-deoxy-D-xylulose-5-phosphate synthase N-terminal domain-containing protein n=1 Tax=Zymomonas mobilis TaxID=542 RepID=UPI001F3BBC97|nr:1-deoxy-D-xylulose-5-phosphate synthase N-terminal domain-containing protein [Zymomonas mobilis]
MFPNDKTPLLDKIKTPAELRQLDRNSLRQLADELRKETISAVRQDQDTGRIASIRSQQPPAIGG